MSKFVNYNKRSITLPPGCKDLIDVLHEPAQREATQPTAQAQYGSSRAIRLSSVKRKVSRLLRVEAKMVVLVLNLPDNTLTLNVVRTHGEPWSACAVFPENSQREALIREFFVARGFQVPPGRGTGFMIAGLPAESILVVSPLPAEPDLIAKLAADLFREVCGLGDHSLLLLGCHFEECVFESEG
jgi:hypothetical protein